MHGHTGVITHLTGLSARADGITASGSSLPMPGAVGGERTFGVGIERVGRERDLGAKREESSQPHCRETSGTHHANTPVLCCTRSIHHYHIYSIDTVQVQYRYLQVGTVWMYIRVSTYKKK